MPSSKKRKACKENWVRNVRKSNKNKGLPYQTTSGQNIPAKQIGEPCNSNCIYECSAKFSTEKRESIFTSFYELGDKNKQWDFFNRHDISVAKKTYRPNSNRTCTKHYFLPQSNDPLLSPSTLANTHNWVETAEKKLRRTDAISL